MPPFSPSPLHAHFTVKSSAPREQTWSNFSPSSSGHPSNKFPSLCASFRMADDLVRTKIQWRCPFLCDNTPGPSASFLSFPAAPTFFSADSSRKTPRSQSGPVRSVGHSFRGPVSPPTPGAIHPHNNVKPSLKPSADEAQPLADHNHNQ